MRTNALDIQVDPMVPNPTLEAIVGDGRLVDGRGIVFQALPPHQPNAPRRGVHLAQIQGIQPSLRWGCSPGRLNLPTRKPGALMFSVPDPVSRSTAPTRGAASCRDNPRGSGAG